MGNRFPKIFTGSRICIIYEGDEEYEYLEKVMSLDVWSKEYCFQLENAGGKRKHSCVAPGQVSEWYSIKSYIILIFFCAIQ